LRVDRPSKLLSSALKAEILLKLMSKNLRMPAYPQVGQSNYPRQLVRPVVRDGVCNHRNDA
jgi:hypothetical protein